MNIGENYTNQWGQILERRLPSTADVHYCRLVTKANGRSTERSMNETTVLWVKSPSS